MRRKMFLIMLAAALVLQGLCCPVADIYGETIQGVSLMAGDAYEIPDPVCAGVKDDAIMLFTVSKPFTLSAGESYKYLTDGQKAIYAAYLASADYLDTHYVEVASDARAVVSDLKPAVRAVMNDHPEIFWCTGASSYYRSADVNENEEFYVMSIAMSSPEITDEEALSQSKAVFDKAVDEFLADIDLAQAPAKIALDVHDKIIAEAEYDYDTQNGINTSFLAHSAYGSLVLKLAVCDGYSRGYSYILQKCGIRSVIVRSDVIRHAWNMVYLDNGNDNEDDDWYETDLTWDDQIYESYQHRWYNQTTENMLAKHDSNGVKGVRESTGLSAQLPEARGTTFTYEYTLTLVPEDKDTYQSAVSDMMVQYKVSSDNEYTVRVVYETADVSGLNAIGIRVTMENGQTENVVGKTVYNKLNANGKEIKSENGYFVVVEITKVPADAVFTVCAVLVDSEGCHVLETAGMVNMPAILKK